MAKKQWSAQRKAKMDRTAEITQKQHWAIKDVLKVDVYSNKQAINRGDASDLIALIRANQAEKKAGLLSTPKFNEAMKVLREKQLKLGATDSKNAKKVAKRPVKKATAPKAKPKVTTSVGRWSTEVPAKRTRKATKKAPAKTLAEKATKIKAAPVINVSSAPAC